MKTNDYLLATATAAYSYLFYMQNAGINFLVFTIVFAAVLLIRNRELIRNLKWTWTLILCLTSALGVFLTSSALAIIANVFCLLLLSALTFNVRTSFIFSFLFSCYSVASAVVWTVIDLIRRIERNKETAPKARSYKGVAVAAVLFLCLIFFALYKQANPLFAENTKWINLDFISFRWIIFTIGGFFLVYGLFYHQNVPAIEGWENNLKTHISDSSPEQSRRFETEHFAGTLLFILLNLMLVILNYGDISTIWFKGTLPKGVSHSDFVHNGVGVIILSILIATALIMYLFRKNYAEKKKGGILLKVLVYGWIIQNLVMLFSTASRNQMYIHDFNFTYKRIGVYVWIALAAIGLVLAFIKVIKDKSNWYLVKSNFALWFSVLAVSSLVNWDLVITRYNLSNKPSAQVDYYYLFSLSDSNIPELIAVARQADFPQFKDKLKNFTHRRDDYYHEGYMSLLREKIYHYVKDYSGDWQSYDLRDARVTASLYQK
jgi:hypothetical protein